MRELKVMTGVVLMVIMMIIGTWHAARACGGVRVW